MTTGPLHESDINRVLVKVVDHNGLVDYHSPELEAMVLDYARAVENMDLMALGRRDEGLAFWINTYNIIVMLGVINEIKKDPKFIKKGTKGLGVKLRFYQRTKYMVAGVKRSLNDMQNHLREEFLDPRIHFVVTPGTRSGPTLKRTLYSADVIYAELEQATHDYINSPLGSVLDKDKMVLHLSYHFKIYTYDLGFEDGVVGFVTRFHDEGDLILRSIGTLKVKYMKYDWSPNIRDMVLG